jgi:ADP-ribose pyrophosphatase YjhB (NUDIX family)
MSVKERFAHVLRRAPWAASLITRLYRLGQARYTAGVNGVLFDAEGRLLLVEHVFHPRHPWGLPGGWVDRRENPSQTVVREFQEELGLAVQVQRVVLVQKGQFFGGHLDMAFLLTGEIPRAALRLSGELRNYGWFAPSDLPPLNPFNQDVVRQLQAEGLWPSGG